MRPIWLLLSAFTGELRPLFAEAEELDDLPQPKKPALTRGRLRDTPALIGAIGLGREAIDGFTTIILGARAAGYQPAAVLAGCCGALQAEHQSGALFAPERFLRIGEEPLRPDPNIQALLGAPQDPGLTADTVAGPADKRRLGAETGAAFIEMESWHVLRRAAELNVPLGALRAVSDRIDESVPNLPPDFDARGRPKIWKGAMMALRHPGSIPKLIKAGRGFAAAQDALGTALLKLIEHQPPTRQASTAPE